MAVHTDLCGVLSCWFLSLGLEMRVKQVVLSPEEVKRLVVYILYHSLSKHADVEAEAETLRISKLETAYQKVWFGATSPFMCQ